MTETETFIVSLGVKEQKVASYVTNQALYKKIEVERVPTLREGAKATGLPSRQAYAQTLRRLVEKKIIVKKDGRYEWHPRFKGDVTVEQQQKSESRQKGH